eukprot:1023939-Pelagomonas_calceolata.AAC.1
MERTKTASGWLWCRAEEPVPVGKTQPGIVQEMFSGTCMPCWKGLSFWQASILIMDEPYLPLLRALTQELRPT